MIPPAKLDVLDRHQGFTELENNCDQPFRPGSPGDTLWRPGRLLKNGTEGTLVDFNETAFYQLNDDVTIARYRVLGWRRPVLCWFDNKTGERIA